MLLPAILVILLLAGVVWLVGAPLRATVAGTTREGRDTGRTDLEVAKEAKYREIRDAEMDHRTGKLSVADYRRLDRQLRAEAVELLRRLDELDHQDPPPAVSSH